NPVFLASRSIICQWDEKIPLVSNCFDPAGDMAALRELCDFPAALSEPDDGGWYPVHRAAVQPRVAVLEMLLHASSGPALEQPTLDGETPLTLAARAGLVENVELLLELGASPQNTNSSNETPLLLAVRAGSYQLVSSLIVGGALVGQRCLRKWTAMHEASRLGRVDVLELLLRSGGRVSETDQQGVTPLAIAAEHGHPEALELLIKNGADVNARAPNGDSVLSDAADSGNPECINLLLQHGADPNAPSLSCLLPIHRAAHQGNLALRILIPLTSRRAIWLSGQSPVHSAADGGHADCLELLIQSGFDANALLVQHLAENYRDLRRSALYFAVSNGYASCTKVLLDAGAKTDLDPLHCLLVAVRSGRHEIVKLLLAAKADVNCYFNLVSDTVFPTALQYCLKDEAMMRLLLSGGYEAHKCFICDHDSERDELQQEKVTVSSSFCDFIGVSWLRHLAGGVVSVLLEYVGQVTLCSKLSAVLQTHRDWPHIHTTTCNPRSLCHLSRLIIRKQLSAAGRAPAAVPLPARLRDFLLFQEAVTCPAD
uniref:Ankyrin repeat and SOCS box containing 15 n=1 Tax=Myripristis murdjan TaxID=586833 RepID=A0A667X4P2_9TELE